MSNIGVYISVKSDNMMVTIPLKRRITFIRGDSGKGKTIFVDNVEMALQNGNSEIISIDYSDGYYIKILRQSMNMRLSSIIADSLNSIIIVDDNVGTEFSENFIDSSVKFNGSILKTLCKKNIYLLIINRVDINNSSFNGLSTDCGYSAKTILYWDYDAIDKRYIVEPLL